MTINHTIQNTWEAEGTFHVLPSFVLYYNNDMLSKDYGLVVRWVIGSYGREMWTD